MKALIVALCAAFLVACGGGGNQFDGLDVLPQVEAAEPSPTATPDIEALIVAAVVGAVDKLSLIHI